MLDESWFHMRWMAQQLHTSVECCDLAIRQLLVTLYFEKSANLGNTAFRIHMTNPKLFGATEWAFMIDQAVFDPACAASDSMLLCDCIFMTCHKLKHARTHHRLPVVC